MFVQHIGPVPQRNNTRPSNEAERRAEDHEITCLEVEYLYSYLLSTKTFSWSVINK